MHCDSSYIDYTHWYMHFRYIFSKQPMRNLNCAHEWLIWELRNLSCIYLKPFNKAKNHSNSSLHSRWWWRFSNIFFDWNSNFGTGWSYLDDWSSQIIGLKAVYGHSKSPKLRQSCAKYIGTSMKINKKISKRLKLSPRPPKSMLYVYIVVVYPIHGNFEKK